MTVQMFLPDQDYIVLDIAMESKAKLEEPNL